MVAVSLILPPAPPPLVPASRASDGTTGGNDAGSVDDGVEVPPDCGTVPSTSQNNQYAKLVKPIKNISCICMITGLVIHNSLLTTDIRPFFRRSEIG